MEIYVKKYEITIFSLFFWFSITTLSYTVHWFYPYRSFKRSNWWRHKLSHT